METIKSVTKKMRLNKYFLKKKKATIKIIDIESSNKIIVKNNTNDIDGTIVGNSSDVSETTVKSSNVTTTTTIKEQRNEEIREELKNNKLSNLEILDYNTSLFKETKDNEIFN
ncbi:hypothetical protein ABK040_009393 [Willaertia magna]